MTFIRTSYDPCSVEIHSTPYNRFQLELTLMCSSSYSTTADHSRHNSPTLKLLSPRSLPPFSAFKDDDEAVGSQEDVVFVDDGCNEVDEALEEDVNDAVVGSSGETPRTSTETRGVAKRKQMSTGATAEAEVEVMAELGEVTTSSSISPELWKRNEWNMM